MKANMFRFHPLEEKMLEFNTQHSGAANKSEFVRGIIAREFTWRVVDYCADLSLKRSDVAQVIAFALSRQDGPDAGEWVRWLDRLVLLLEKVPDTKAHKHALVMHLGNSPLDLETGWTGEK